ncbi:MAG TPA: hybrid sensor histidine kinase/response regulator, partial [Anaerolineae bacterium]|nr:hybrid sensor histidine kinase/response regulator [Anaerolineae bacterium]
MIQAHLETLGYTVVGEAANGQQGIELAQELQPDVILMDLKMPQMDGIEASRRIQECCPAPVVILTAFESPDLVRQASEAGVGAYLVKPANARELERAITIARARFNDLMELRRLNAALQESQRRLEEQNIQLRKLTQAVEQSANTIVITDVEGRIEYVNPKFVETTGYTVEEALGQNPRILKSGEQDTEFYREMWETIRAGRVWHGEFHNRRKDGSFYWEMATIAPVCDEEGRITHFIAVKEDITGRKEMEIALQQERNLLRTLIDSLPDLILAKDRQGRFILANQALAQMAGASSPEDMIGKTEFDYVPYEVAAKFWQVEQEVIRTGQPVVNRTERSVDPSGKTRWILTTKVPLYDHEGGIRGVVGIARDITALKEAEEQLRRYAEQLEEQNAELDAFAHTVAHDLKNPVNVFLGYASMLEREYDALSAEMRQKFLQILVQHAHKMNTIINELLLLASVRERDEIDLEPLEMDLIVEEALSQLQYMIQESGAEIILPEQWPQALGHAPWVEAMWVNYISNAIKYGGDPPRVELGADLLDVGQVGNLPNMIRFWVRDNGPGLSPEEQSRLFTPFERLHQSRAQGHGLGLCIVQRIAGKLGGQVGVESQVGQGSTFYFTLPAVA